MPPETHEISHVSDTALMTAACRAIETDRPDGLIHDPFAAQLAGARGMASARPSTALDGMCVGIDTSQFVINWC
jgi:O-methyltransferase involved in polyketide biosynthesis